MDNRLEALKVLLLTYEKLEGVSDKIFIEARIKTLVESLALKREKK